MTPELPVTQSRRDFLGTAAAAAAGLTLSPGLALPQTLRLTAPPSRPVVIGSNNGIRGVKVAYDKIVAGADTLDAIIAGVNIQELDPDDQSVGLGGLPNEEGVVQLDASCMHGPTKRAGPSGASRTSRRRRSSRRRSWTTPITSSSSAPTRGVSRSRWGSRPQNLLTEKSRQDWLRWKANLNPNDFWLDHKDDVKINCTHGTCNMNAVNAAGDMSSVTTTSGMSWKIPGRVGDSPIIGAGQYCDNTVGAAGSTGRGEANIKVCGAFLAVELMRQGKSPEAALMIVMERVIAMTEKRLLGANGRPLFDLTYYAVNKAGEFAGACAYEGTPFAVCDKDGARSLQCAYLYKNSERPR